MGATRGRERDIGDHYIPRDAIRLLVDLLFAEKDIDLTEPGIIRTLYDPTAGTGGMLIAAADVKVVYREKDLITVAASSGGTELPS